MTANKFNANSKLLKSCIDLSHEIAREAIFYIDPHSRIIYICPHYKLLVGEKMSEESLSLEKWIKSLYKNDREKVKQTLDTFIVSSRKTNRYFEIDFRVAPVKNEFIHLSMRGGFSNSQGDGKTNIFGIFSDITSRIDNEKRLEQLNENLVKRDKILEALMRAGEKFWVSEKTEKAFGPVLESLGKVLGVSRVYIFRNEKDEFAKFVSKLICEWTAPEIERHIQNPSMKGFSPEAFGMAEAVSVLSENREFHGALSDFKGRARQFLESRQVRAFLLIPILIKEEFAGVIGFDDCETERKWVDIEVDALRIVSSFIGALWLKELQNKELLASEKKYRDIIENSSEGFIIIGLDQKVKFANKRMAEIFGLSVGDLLKKDLEELIQHDDSGAMALNFSKLDTGERLTTDLMLKHNSGKILTVKRVTSPMMDIEGKITGYFSLITDITENIKLKQELKVLSHEGVPWKFHDIIGISPVMKEAFGLIENASRTDCNIFIEGPSGTGKSLIAKTIHELSARSEGPFIVVNCGAIPETLIESELFGYVKGAFTDAKINKPGRFALANGGTIFLDEISEMPFALQVKLLRVIEEKKYEPLGSVKTIDANVRIIAATNRDIAERLRGGFFREDLYYRLKIIGIKIPPLCERSEDIIFIVNNFIEKLNEKYSRSIKDICAKIRAFFQNYDFPGNIRELQNIIESAFVTCDGDVITLKDLPAEYKKIAATGSRVVADVQQLKTVSEITEISTILSALEKCGNNKTTAAKMLDIDRITLWRKMRKYNLK